MTDKEVKLSSKNQIVIPKEAREYIHANPGDKLMLTISVGGHLLLWKKPKSYTEYMKGLGQEAWRGINVRTYLKNIRKEWD